MSTNEMTLARLDFDPSGFANLMERCTHEPTWLRELRSEAWQRFEQMPWPNRRDEEWMRTDIRLFNLKKYHWSPETSVAASSLPLARLDVGVELAGRIATIDGITVLSELEDSVQGQGVFFGTLQQALIAHPAMVQRHLFRSAFDASVDRFAALHQAMCTGGTVLYVPRNVSVALPFHIQTVLSDGGSDLSHLLIVLEDGASATVLYESCGTHVDGDGWHNGAMELVIGDRAKLSFVNLQDWGNKTWHFAHQKAIVGQDAQLQWTLGALGGRLAKVNQHVELRGRGAHCQVNGTMFTQDQQHLSYHTLQHHMAPQTTSDFLYKTALQDQSHTVWRGMIRVDKVAQRTDGYQRNDNLLLSNTSRADSIPGLEIEADDVRCTHGSTSGRVDEEQVFYCLNRGFTRQEAIRAIVTGFFQQIFDRIELESVREALGIAIATRVRQYE
ncbi:MAG: Fe-S cluster assembly protein SufD [Planctomycetaceae bacterium]|nr:Fe-S cluster assembly protein SufD [Planctomycetaceae bacterium]